MQKVLLIEDSRTFATVIKKTIETDMHFPVDWAPTYADAIQRIDGHGTEYFVALIDLHLPDASKGEALDLVLSQGIPPIVLTGKFGDEIREYIWSKKVVDYVLKDNPQIDTSRFALMGFSRGGGMAPGGRVRLCRGPARGRV